MMRKYLSWSILLFLLISCQVDLLVKTYEYDWSLELATKSEGTFLKPSKSGKSLLVLSQHENSGKAFKVSSTGKLEDSNDLSFGDYILENHQFSNPDGSQNFLGRIPGSDHQILILFVGNDSEITFKEVDLRAELPATGTRFLNFGSSLYYEKSANAVQNTLVKMDFSGILMWEFSVSGYSIKKVIEGNEESIHLLLTNSNGDEQLMFLQSDGDLKWTKQINTSNGLIPEIKESTDIYSSPSNTVNLFGNNGAGGLIMGVIDPRGELVFSKFYQNLGNAATSDLIVTSDGSFFLALVDAKEFFSSFSIIRFNYQGIITWESEFIPLLDASYVYLTETVNNNVVISTNVGELYNLSPMD